MSEAPVVGRARIGPKEPAIPLSVLLMPSAGSQRIDVPDWNVSATRPPFPGQTRGNALVASVLTVALVAAAALVAAPRAVVSPFVGPGLGNLRSPFNRVVLGAPVGGSCSLRSALSLGGTACAERAGATSFSSSSSIHGLDSGAPRTPRPTHGRRAARTIAAATSSSSSHASTD